MTTLTEVANHPLIQQKYQLLARAAEAVASPQIRNQATIGGNVSQDARCWYYRAGWPCYRAGGNICYADTPDGRNREHAILHAERCVAVNPSDTAPALIALDARFVLQTAKGERVISAEDYFVGPDIDITRLTSCGREICSPASGSRQRGPARNSISRRSAIDRSGIFRCSTWPRR